VGNGDIEKGTSPAPLHIRPKDVDVTVTHAAADAAAEGEVEVHVELDRDELARLAHSGRFVVRLADRDAPAERAVEIRARASGRGFEPR
jgi:hypothetical protein